MIPSMQSVSPKGWFIASALRLSLRSNRYGHMKMIIWSPLIKQCTVTCGTAYAPCLLLNRVCNLAVSRTTTLAKVHPHFRILQGYYVTRHLKESEWNQQHISPASENTPSTYPSTHDYMHIPHTFPPHSSTLLTSPMHAYTHIPTFPLPHPCTPLHALSTHHTYTHMCARTCMHTHVNVHTREV